MTCIGQWFVNGETKSNAVETEKRMKMNKRERKEKSNGRKEREMNGESEKMGRKGKKKKNRYSTWQAFGFLTRQWFSMWG